MEDSGVDISAGMGPTIENDNKQFKISLEDAAMGGIDIIISKDCENRAVDILRHVRGIEHQQVNVYTMSEQLLRNIKQVKEVRSQTISVFARRKTADTRPSKQKQIRSLNLRTMAAESAAAELSARLVVGNSCSSSGVVSSLHSDIGSRLPLYQRLAFAIRSADAMER
jgi:hypothetical protein